MTGSARLRIEPPIRDRDCGIAARRGKAGLLDAAMAEFQPHQVIAYGPPNREAPAVPLLEEPGLVDGQPAVWPLS